MTCASDNDLTKLMVGELPESHAHAVRQHLSECPRCKSSLVSLEAMIQRIAAPIELKSASAMADDVMAKISVRCPARPRPVRASWLWSGGVAMTVAVVLLLTFRAGNERASEFTARGAGAVAWKDLVGVRIHRVRAQQSVDLLRPQALLSAKDGLVASYWAPDSLPLHLLLFAVDARSEVHWLYPAYLDASTDPQAVSLTPKKNETFFSESAMLDSPAPGALKVVWIVSPTPLRVSAIEDLAPEELGIQSLQHRFPSALIESMTLQQQEVPK